MTDPFYLLTPDEWRWADKQVKLLKLELEHNLHIKQSDNDTIPDFSSDFLNGILALEEMYSDHQPISLYDTIGRPPFRPESELTDSEVEEALTVLVRHMDKYDITLKVLSPDDYSARTIYRFVINELFRYETTCLDGDPMTFVYEEFYPNHRYSITRQGETFINGLINENFDGFSDCFEDQFLDQQTIPYYRVNILPEVLNKLTCLLENWWPRTLRHGFVSNVSIAQNTQTAQLTLVLQLGAEGETQLVQEEAILYLNRWDFWWKIERIELGDWVLE